MIIDRIIRGWNPFFFKPLDPRPLAIFRILTGALCTVMFAVSLPNWGRFFHSDGIISLHSLDLNNTRVNTPFGLFYWTEDLIPMSFWWFASIVLSVMFMVGWQSRLATIGLYVMIESMLRRNPYISNGEDMVLRMCLLYMVFSQPGAVWSLDARRRAVSGRAAVRAIASWPIRMMQINVALIYLISLPYKFAQDPGWVTGDALHWTVASDMWGPFHHPWITLSFGGWLRTLMTFGTVLVEAFFPLFVWFSPTRRIAILSIATLHLGIAFTIPNVTYFTLSMVCTFSAFMTSEDIEFLQRCLLTLRRRLRSVEAGSKVSSSSIATGGV